MTQKQYSAKPLKVLADQYFAAANPPAVGVCVCTLGGPIAAPAHAHVDGGITYLHDTDWIVHNRAGTRLDSVMTDADFQEAFNVPGV